MLKVLTLSTLFPDASRPTFGIFVERQTRELAAIDGVDVRVVAPRGLPPRPFRAHPHYRALAAVPLEEQWQGLTVYRPAFPSFPGVPKRIVAPLLARALMPLLGRIRRDFAFDIINAEFFFPDGPAAALLARSFNLPFSIKARGADIHHWGGVAGCREQILRAGKQAGGLLAVSDALRRDMIALGLPDEHIRVHYTGVDLDRFHPDAGRGLKETLGVSGPLLLTAGHLIPRKGQGFVVDAMKTLGDATLLLVGDGPDRARLEAQISNAGMQGRVRLLGARGHDELPALFAAADVVVQPSSSEGLANVWVEALASGTPVVTCDVGGAGEVIDRPEAGRLVPRDPSAIASAVRALLHARSDAEAVRRSAQRFTWKANRQTLSSHLHALAEKRG